MQRHYDVIIVGAGLVGMVLALTLSRAGMKIALLEAGDLKPSVTRENEYHLRVSAINPSCKDMFVDLNVWDKIISSGRLSAFEKMFVWDSLGRGEIHFDCTEIAQPCLGYIIENAIIFNALFEELKNYSNLTFLTNQQLTGLALSSHRIEVQYQEKIASSQDQKTYSLSAELLVGADGSNSWVRQQANIESYMWPYNHEALVTTVETERPHEKTAWQCFLADGPLALLPLYSGNVCSIVWSGMPDEIKRLQSLDDDAFNLEITHAFENRLGKIKKISKQLTVPLYMRHAKKYINDRIALVGDAAHTIHPLAGQGINLGFADACLLAKTIIQAKQSNKNCGDYIALRQYERSRKSDNWVMIFGMEFFKRLFQSESGATIHMRSLGLKMVDKMNLIKNQFIYRAI